MPVSKMARNKGTDMGNWVSRKQATEIINATFSMFHYGLMAMPDMGIKNTKEKEVFFRAAWKLDETINTDNYADTVNALDTTGFKEYYNLIGAFAKKYKIANWKDYSTYEPVLIEHLNEELGRHEKTEEKLELINSFHDEELCSETFPSASKIRVLYDILDDCFVLGNKENGINRILRTFNENDKTAFITKIQSDDKLLASFIKKVNGGEKDEMLATIGEIFISSGFIKDRKTVLLDNKKTDTLTASLNKGKIYIKMESLAESTNLVPGGMEDYPNIPRRTVTVSPFDIVNMNYDGRHIRVPALLLLNSWSNSAATPEGIFYNYYKEDVDWLRLSDAARDTYFAEFVMHYLPSGFIEALGNPIQLVITGIITVGLAIVTGGASIAAELEVAMAAAGIALSAASAVGSIRGVLTADEMRQAAQTTHEVKKAAKFMAECIAALSLSVIDLLCFWLEHKKWKKGKKNATKLEKLNEIQQNTKKFSNWEEIKNTYKGKVTQFVKDNKPKYSPDLKNWFAERGTLEIKEANGNKIWTYTNSVSDSVPYINGYVKFPEKYLYPGIGEINIGNFSGERFIDNAKLIEILDKVYNISTGIPKGYIPHHDVNKGIIQLVEKQIHTQFTHIGGHSLHGGK